MFVYLCAKNTVMTSISEYPTATPESVWAAIHESNRFLTEKFAESDRQRKENERILNEKFAETDKKFAKTERLVEKVSQTLGSWGNNHGCFAEEYFFNSFESGKKNFFGEKFKVIEKNVKGIEEGFKDEYDILLINGKSVGIVEVKYKAHKNDVPKILKKAKTFRVNFPNYAKHRVYLGLATMAFYPKLEEECIKQGIAVVKQVGDTVVINDTNLKVF
jgi:hypothetical protein